MLKIDEQHLLVCSKSTQKFFPSHEKIFIVNKAPDENIYNLRNSENDVIAIGGGAVIDTAKILSNNPIVCYPTTAAGSSNTSHSVWWNGIKKESLLCKIPKETIIVNEFLYDVPDKVRFETKCDLISHCLDSLWSKNKTPESEKYANDALCMIKENDYTSIVNAGILGGKAIEITTTNVLHAISYPLTGIYGISHGMAMSFLIPIVSKYMNFEYPKNDYIKNIGKNVNWDIIIEESFSYSKIHDSNKAISKEDLKKIIELVVSKDKE